MLCLLRAPASMTYSTGDSTPSSPIPSMKGTVTSTPGMNSSTSTPAGYTLIIFSTSARTERPSRATESSPMPLEDPS